MTTTFDAEHAAACVRDAVKALTRADAHVLQLAAEVRAAELDDIDPMDAGVWYFQIGELDAVRTSIREAIRRLESGTGGW